MGNIFVVTEVSTLLIVTRVSSGVKSCVTVGPISLMVNVWPCINPVDYLSGLAL